MRPTPEDVLAKVRAFMRDCPGMSDDFKSITLNAYEDGHASAMLHYGSLWTRADFTKYGLSEPTYFAPDERCREPFYSSHTKAEEAFDFGVIARCVPESAPVSS